MFFIIIFFLFISPLIGHYSIRLSEITKVPLILLLVFLGIVLGDSSPINILGRNYLQPSITTYSSLISMAIIFIMAGFSIDIKSIKSNLKLAVKLSTIPVYINLVVVTLASLTYIKLFHFTHVELGTFSIYGVLLFAFMISLSAPVLIVPSVIKLKPDYKKIGSASMVGYVLDNYTLLPIIFPVAALGIAVYNGVTLSLGSVGLIVFASIFGMTLMTVLGLAMGYFSKKFISINNTFISCLIFCVICIGSSILISYIPFVGKFLKSFSILFDIGYGLGLKLNTPPTESAVESQIWQKVVALFAFPIMFLGLGGRTNIFELLNLNLLVFILFIFIVNRCTKLFTINQILKREGVHKDEVELSMKLAFFDGASPINLSIAFSPILLLLGQSDITILAALYGIITFVATILIGERSLTKYYN